MAPVQMEAYRASLRTSIIRSIVFGTAVASGCAGSSFVAISHLRKLCNHPDLVLSGEPSEEGEETLNQSDSLLLSRACSTKLPEG